MICPKCNKEEFEGPRYPGWNVHWKCKNCGTVSYQPATHEVPSNPNCYCGNPVNHFEEGLTELPDSVSERKALGIGFSR